MLHQTPLIGHSSQGERSCRISDGQRHLQLLCSETLRMLQNQWKSKYSTSTCYGNCETLWYIFLDSLVSQSFRRFNLVSAVWKLSLGLLCKLFAQYRHSIPSISIVPPACDWWRSMQRKHFFQDMPKSDLLIVVAVVATGLILEVKAFLALNQELLTVYSLQIVEIVEMEFCWFLLVSLRHWHANPSQG